MGDLSRFDSAQMVEVTDGSTQTVGVTTANPGASDVGLVVRNIPRANSFTHGRKSAISTSAVQVNSSSVACYVGMLVKASNSNSGIVYVGGSGVTADGADSTSGFQLGAGEAVFVETTNQNLVYVIGSASSQTVYYTLY